MHAHNMESNPGIDIFHDGSGSGDIALATFTDLLRPMSKDIFIDKYWGQQPFLIKRSCAGYFDSLISIGDVDDLLSSTTFHGSEIRVAKDGVIVPATEITEDNIVQRDTVWSHFDQGSTIVFEHLSRNHPRLLQLMSTCEQDIRLPFRANAYLTPSTSRGFSLHYDTHDVVILQVSGSKDWQIYDNPMPLPHEEQSFTSDWKDKARLLAEVRLEPGDVLYLPRGFIHGASANSEVSFHTTIGIRSVTLHDIYMSALKRMLLSRREFRPVFRFSDIERTASTAKQALLESLDEVDFARALRDADLSFLKKRTRPIRGRLTRMNQPPDLDATTLLRMSPGVLCHMKEAHDGITFFFDKLSMRLPTGIKPALELVCSRSVFCAASLPGLEDESKLILVRKLLDHQLLDVVDVKESSMSTLEVE